MDQDEDCATVLAAVGDLRLGRRQIVEQRRNGGLVRRLSSSYQQPDRAAKLLDDGMVLVNCTGTGDAFKTASRARRSGWIVHFPLDQFVRILRINLIGIFRCIAKSAAGMLAVDTLEGAELGVVVNTASVAAEDKLMARPPTRHQRWGSSVWRCRCLATSLDEGIRVNTTLPRYL